MAVLVNDGATSNVTPDAETVTVYVPLWVAAKPRSPEYFTPFFMTDSVTASISTATAAPPGPVTATAFWSSTFEPDAA
jgi:hypothetical protein